MTEIYTKKVVGNPQTASTNVTSTSNSNQVISTGVGQTGMNAQLEATLTKLEISYEEYLKYCEQNPEFATYDVSKQKEIVAANKVSQATNASAPSETDVSMLSTPASLATTEVDATASIASTPIEQAETIEQAFEPIEIQELDSSKYDGISFDFNHFNELSFDDQLNLFFEKYAKNKFLYGDPNQKRTEEDWNRLSNEEKQSLISQSTSIINGQFQRDKFCEGNLATFLGIKMEELQIANSKEMSFAEYNNLSVRDKEGARLDFLQKAYIAEDDEAFNVVNTLDISQRHFVETQFETTQGLRMLLEQHKDKLSGVKFKGKLLTELALDENSSLTQTDIQQILRGINLKIPKSERLSVVDLQYNYLNSMQDPNDPTSLTENQQHRLRSLTSLVNSNFYKNNKLEIFKRPETNYLETDLINDPQYGELWKSTSNNDTRILILSNFLEEKLKDKTDNEKAEYFSNIIHELNWMGVTEAGSREERREIRVANSALVNDLFKFAFMKMNKEEQVCLASQDNLLTATLTVDNMNEETPAEVALAAQATQVVLNAEADSPEVRQAIDGLAITTMDNVSAEVNLTLSPGYAGFDSEEVQNHHVATAYRINRENPENGHITAGMLINTALHSTDEARANATERVGELSAEHETSVLTALTKDCSLATQRAIEKDVASTLDVENQADAVKLLRDNVQTQFEGEDVDKYLTTLADNIHNLDKSAQQDALNHIYESGNQSAINKALENLSDLTKTPVVLQEAEMPRLFEEIIVKTALNDADLAGLDLTQQLSSVQIASLTPAEKQKYYMNMFTQASANDKIKILEKLPNGTQKKIIFTVIARFAPRLLENMVDAGLGIQMLSSNLPMDASNKVLKAMVNSDNPDVKKQVADIKKDKNYQDRLANIEGSSVKYSVDLGGSMKNNMTTPSDFARTIGLTTDDVINIDVQTMFARYRQGGFRA